ncbi:uncharacterized protein LOC143230324 isoform X7 [Tachypleus tridentatus]|uniref:uncharacterized protein LOC143230324 isoform X7 n=1 Tax=Tachypleus tridentatus TaxID=6853 RepID=UPI003FD1241F
MNGHVFLVKTLLLISGHSFAIVSAASCGCDPNLEKRIETAEIVTLTLNFKIDNIKARIEGLETRLETSEKRLSKQEEINRDKQQELSVLLEKISTLEETNRSCLNATEILKKQLEDVSKKLEYQSLDIMTIKDTSISLIKSVTELIKNDIVPGHQDAYDKESKPEDDEKTSTLQPDENKWDKQHCELVTSDKDLKVFHQGKPVMNGDRVKDGGDIMLFCLQGKTVNSQPIFKKVTCHNGQWNTEIPSCPFDSESKPEGLETEQNKLDKVDCELVISDKDLKVFHQGKPVMNGDRVKDGGDIMLFCLQRKTVNNQPIFKKVTCHNGQWNTEIPSCPFNSEFKPEGLETEQNKLDKVDCELEISDKDLKVFHQGKPVMNGDRVKDGGDIMLFCLQRKTVNNQPIFKKVTCHNGQWNMEIPSCPFDSESKPQGNEDDKDITKPEGLETGQNKFDKVDCELEISDKDLKVFHQGKPVMNGDRVKDGDDIMLFCLQGKTVNNQAIFKKVTCHNGQWNTEILSCPFNSDEEYEEQIIVEQNRNKQAREDCELVTSDKDLKIFHQGKPVGEGHQVKNGDDIMLFCLHEKTLNNEPVIKKVTCHNGQWNTEIPSCSFDSESQCTIHKLYDILPSGIIPRFIKDNYKRGEEVEVYCNNPGYFISGQKTVWCSPKGHWHQTDLKCEQGCKLLEPGPTSTIIILNRKPYYRFGEKMVLACPQGQYLENGVHSIVCLSPIWSDEFLPSCVDTED